MAFVLIPFTSSIAVGASYSFVVMFAIWAVTPNIVKISPQMVCAFSMSVLLLVVVTGLVQTSAAMGAVLGGCIGFSIVIAIFLHVFGARIEAKFADSQFDPGSTKQTGNSQTIHTSAKKGKQHKSEPSNMPAAGASSALFSHADSRIYDSQVVSATYVHDGQGGVVAEDPMSEMA